MRVRLLIALLLSVACAEPETAPWPSPEPSLAKPLTEHQRATLGFPPALLRALPTGPETPVFALVDGEALVGFGFEAPESDAALYVHGLRRIGLRSEEPAPIVWSAFANEPARRRVLVLTARFDNWSALRLSGVSDDVLNTYALGALLDDASAGVSLLLASPEGVLLEISAEPDETLVDRLVGLGAPGHAFDRAFVEERAVEGLLWLGR